MPDAIYYCSNILQFGILIMKYRLLVALPVVMMASSTNAIMTQHDTSIQHYFEYAQNPIFDAVGQLDFGFAVNSRCTGVLLDERTVLTAGHCIERFAVGGFALPGEQTISGSFSLSPSRRQIDGDPKGDRFQIIGGRRLSPFLMNGASPTSSGFFG